MKREYLISYKSPFQHETAWRYILLSLLTHLVISNLAIQVWRALWILMDNVILPTDVSKIESCIIAAGTGYAACTILFTLQYPLFLIARRLREKNWILEYMFDAVIKLIVVFSCILLWRGTWAICRDHFLKTELHFWLAHFISIGTLFLMGTATTIAHPGRAVDFQNGWGRDQIYDVDYFLEFYNQANIQVMGYNLRLHLIGAIWKYK